MIGQLYTEKLVKVYVARGGRKFFSKAAARRRGAWDLIKQHCTCHWDMPEEQGDGPGRGFVRCKYHQEFAYDDQGELIGHRGINLHTKIVRRSKREEARATKGGR